VGGCHGSHVTPQSLSGSHIQSGPQFLSYVAKGPTKNQSTDMEYMEYMGPTLRGEA